MILIRKLNKNFRKLTALQDIDLDFDSGQVVSLIGPNGSGKTTLIKCILGLVRPDSADITIDGSSVLHSFAYRAQLGYKPQIGRYPDQMRIGELFELLKNVRSAPAGGFDEELIEAYQLRQIFDKPMRTLSGGTRQKVSAAVAFLFDPRILILDEPLGGMTLRDVDAVVPDGPGLEVALLGMSFLTRTEMRREGANLTLTKRY